MKLSGLMTANAVISGLFGLGFLAMPAQVLSYYGMTSNADLDYMARLFGAALIAFAVLSWMAKGAGDSSARRAIVTAFVVGDFVGFIVALMAQLNGVVNTLGWSTVAIYLILALGFSYFAFGKTAAD